MSDDVRTCTCYKKIKSVAVIMSRKMYVLFEMEVVKNARKFVRCCQVRISVNVEVMISSEGKGTKNSRRFWNSSKKVEILEDGGR